MRVVIKAKEISLTAREYELLKLLISNPHKVFTKENIFVSVWGEDDFKEASIYGFIGLNGAGKAPLIRLITGLTKPAKGSLELFGHSGERDIQRDGKNIGTLVERPGLHPFGVIEIRGLFKKLNEDFGVKIVISSHMMNFKNARQSFIARSLKLISLFLGIKCLRTGP